MEINKHIKNKTDLKKKQNRLIKLKAGSLNW